MNDNTEAAVSNLKTICFFLQKKNISVQSSRIWKLLKKTSNCFFRKLHILFWVSKISAYIALRATTSFDTIQNFSSVPVCSCVMKSPTASVYSESSSIFAAWVFAWSWDPPKNPVIPHPLLPPIAFPEPNIPMAAKLARVTGAPRFVLWIFSVFSGDKKCGISFCSMFSTSFNNSFNLCSL